MPIDESIGAKGGLKLLFNINQLIKASWQFCHKVDHQKILQLGRFRHFTQIVDSTTLVELIQNCHHRPFQRLIVNGVTVPLDPLSKQQDRFEHDITQERPHPTGRPVLPGFLGDDDLDTNVPVLPAPRNFPESIRPKGFKISFDIQHDRQVIHAITERRGTIPLQDLPQFNLQIPDPAIVGTPGNLSNRNDSQT
ncbi:MAG: hypothetical protein JNL10_17355 [Verrucomicrobiales bacterium]|nr:hypothetical protein [Verrucomicrobiales bacterium]